MAKRRKEFFLEVNFRRFIAACPPWLAAFSEFGVLTGMRPGEIRRLERSNVTPRAGITVDGEEWGVIGLRADQTKAREEQAIPLMPHARDILEGLPVSARHPGLYFLGHRGKPITRGMLRHHFDAARGRAGLPVARPHMLRHTTASWLIQRGVPLPVIQQILRHKNYQTTLGYAHLLPAHLAPAMALLLPTGKEIS